MKKANDSSSNVSYKTYAETKTNTIVVQERDQPQEL